MTADAKSTRHEAKVNARRNMVQAADTTIAMLSYKGLKSGADHKMYGRHQAAANIIRILDLPPDPVLTDQPLDREYHARNPAIC